MDYLQLKYLHIGLATLSVAGFVLRWSWMMRGSELARHRLTRILPHIADTLFLASGIWLAALARLNPLAAGWFGGKLLGVVAYIVLASIAYKHARGRTARILFFALALLTFAWVFSVARYKSLTVIFGIG